VQTPSTASSAPPPRPDAAPGTLRRERRWLPTIAVTAVIAFVVLGGYIAAAALSTPAGPPETVNGIVTVQPLSDWVFAGRLESRAGPGIRLTRGSGTLDVFAAPFAGDAQDLAERYAVDVLEPEAERLSVSPNLEQVRLPNGATGVRFGYVGIFGQAGGTPIEGEVTAVVSPSGAGVVFDGWAPQGLLRFVLGDEHTMIDRARVA
jgi:hypothetical protein